VWREHELKEEFVTKELRYSWSIKYRYSTVFLTNHHNTMASSHRNRTPSTLEPYLTLLPAQSLTLLTNTLGCSANWLTSRFAISALNNGSEATSVVLVSWMRDLVFWKDELRRAAVGGHT
jgi:hypothetical protein